MKSEGVDGADEHGVRVEAQALRQADIRRAEDVHVDAEQVAEVDEHVGAAVLAQHDVEARRRDLVGAPTAREAVRRGQAVHARRLLDVCGRLRNLQVVRKVADPMLSLVDAARLRVVAALPGAHRSSRSAQVRVTDDGACQVRRVARAHERGALFEVQVIELQAAERAERVALCFIRLCLDVLFARAAVVRRHAATLHATRLLTVTASRA